MFQIKQLVKSIPMLKKLCVNCEMTTNALSIKLIYITRQGFPQVLQGLSKFLLWLMLFIYYGSKFICKFIKKACDEPPLFESHKRLKYGFANSSLHYLYFSFVAFVCLLRYPNSSFMTRDILLALITTLAGRKTVYEAHNAPTGLVSSFLLKICFLFPKFRLLAISNALLVITKSFKSLLICFAIMIALMQNIHFLTM